ncbi:hypothetical protein L279_02140 [Mannheimia haemolytica D38]|nr:hypothetical protein L279_02140 [Mannheimia haemolytica D38]EPZ23319.1 hypothetical protein L281_07245 [Mannheimia haemolytica MhSwine2000]
MNVGFADGSVGANKIGNNFVSNNQPLVAFMPQAVFL